MKKTLFFGLAIAGLLALSVPSQAGEKGSCSGTKTSCSAKKSSCSGEKKAACEAKKSEESAE